jgi:hypothetical protein
MRQIFFPILLVSLCSPVSAQVVPVRANLVECDLSDCKTFAAAGSAVHLGRTEGRSHVFLTVAHILAPLSENAILIESGDIQVKVDEEWLPAKLIRSTKSDGVDLALLKVQAPLSHLRCLPLLDHELSANDMVYLAGYPKGGEIRVIEGRVVRTSFVNFPLAIDQRPIEGESGGAVVIDGKLAGIIHGYPSTKQPLCLFTDARAIKQFLETSLRDDPLCFPAE